MLKKTLLATAALTALTSTASAQQVQYYLTRDGQRMTLEQYQQSTVYTQGGVTAAQARGLTGLGAKVVVLDQGFNTNHYDLKGQVDAYEIFYPGRSYKTNYGVHGTAMASIIAGAGGDGIGTVGIAPDATLLLGQIGSGGTSTSIHNRALVNGLVWAEEQQADIVNLSIASNFDSRFRGQTKRVAPGVYQAPANYGSLYGKASTLEALKGINNTSVIVTAAGNQGVAYAAFPGAFATQVDSNGELVFGGRWLIVGSVDANNNISRFSNRAGHICTDLQGTVCKDPYQVKDFFVVAPGERLIVSRDTGKSTDYMATVSSGSSASTAYVSGGLALMKQAWPHLKAEQLVALVKETATDLGAPGVDEIYGHGLVNFDKATQPRGDLKVASTSTTSSVTKTSTSISTTTAVTSGSANFATASILRNAMFVDDVDRQYAVNLSGAVATAPTESYKFANGWFALAPSNYKEVSSFVSKDIKMTMAYTDSGLSNQIEWKSKDNPGIGYSMQFGTLTEEAGFLGNRGTGALGLGNSSTTFSQFGINSTGGDTTTFASFGMGITNTSNASGSMITTDSTLLSQTWAVGFTQSNVFKSNNSDQFSFSLSAPVTVARGNATVSAVTAYNFKENADGSVSTEAVVSKESTSLSPNRQPLDIVMNYNVASSKNSQVGFNFVHQLNVAGTDKGRSALGFNYKLVF
jgi:hypothetical protein